MPVHATDARLAGLEQPEPIDAVLEVAQSLLDRRWPLARTNTSESVRAARELFAMSDADFAHLMAEQAGGA